jgi:hypothetical protein
MATHTHAEHSLEGLKDELEPALAELEKERERGGVRIRWPGGEPRSWRPSTKSSPSWIVLRLQTRRVIN